MGGTQVRRLVVVANSLRERLQQDPAPGMGMGSGGVSLFFMKYLKQAILQEQKFEKTPPLPPARRRPAVDSRRLCRRRLSPFIADVSRASAGQTPTRAIIHHLSNSRLTE